MHDTAAFLAALGDVPAISDPDIVRRKSRDMTANFSPVMKDDALRHVADVLVQPRDRADVLRVASAAARTRMPLVMRGAGTCNFGQGIPLAGGAMVDMTALDRVLAVDGARVRAEPGARMAAIDEATRPGGWELRIHPSTKRVATLGGFVGGGHAGVGSCAWGILRDRGNILGLEVVSVEEEPRTVQLRGDAVNRVHHAYGSNGIITAIDMPLAPAWAWREAVVVFPEFMTAVEFAHALATSDGIVKKLVSVLGGPIWRMMRMLKELGGADNDGMVLAMVAEPFMEAFEALVAEFGGHVASLAAEGQGPYRVPIYELAWGHTRLHVNRDHPEVVSNVGLYLDPDLVGAIRRSHRRFGHLLGMHFEAKRFDGKLSFQGSPFFRYEGDAHLAEVMRGMAEDGAMVANNHTFLVKEGGMKSVDADDRAFKQAMDPHGLMNPGKLRFDEAAARESKGGDLPSAGWRFRGAQAAESADA
ncbi:FAD-binding oxidoreductase [Pseudacidovorax sp. RU35E]|uniref:FAD-binding oxidoreductase n=1 Tax=Pseudacidovorax sp. RU35E TaxID=1907403 RepID=UPI00095582E9|nr:FAD-binding oxidoreductase [Pseudacidovorax sp. RU35E]SIQ73706.1 FAD/FMN-containing dehydrogenase [Pseudacidovorax sp. RU35E]